jgi:hypothetical protein
MSDVMNNKVIMMYLEIFFRASLGGTEGNHKTRQSGRVWRVIAMTRFSVFFAALEIPLFFVKLFPRLTVSCHTVQSARQTLSQVYS